MKEREVSNQVRFNWSSGHFAYVKRICSGKGKMILNETDRGGYDLMRKVSEGFRKL